MKMPRYVTACAERNQILFDVASRPAARLDVLPLEVLSSIAVLKSPSIPFEHFERVLAIRIGFKPLEILLAFYVRKLRGHLSITHGEDIHTAQVPWLAVPHFAIHPAHNRAIAAHDGLLGIEMCVGIA